MSVGSSCVKHQTAVRAIISTVSKLRLWVEHVLYVQYGRECLNHQAAHFKSVFNCFSSRLFLLLSYSSIQEILSGHGFSSLKILLSVPAIHYLGLILSWNGGDIHGTPSVPESPGPASRQVLCFRTGCVVCCGSVVWCT